jgi:hypothetical protein
MILVIDDITLTPSSCMLRGCDVGNVDHGFLQAVAIEAFAARAAHHRVWYLRRKLLAALPRSILPRGPVALITPRLEVGLDAPCREDQPCRFEVGARLIEVYRSAGDVFAGLRPRIEPASPTPLIDINRHTGAFADGADPDVAVVDAPAFLAGFRIAAAGEGGHGSLKRGGVGIGNTRQSLRLIEQEYGQAGKPQFKFQNGEKLSDDARDVVRLARKAGYTVNARPNGSLEIKGSGINPILYHANREVIEFGNWLKQQQPR